MELEKNIIKVYEYDQQVNACSKWVSTNKYLPMDAPPAYCCLVLLLLNLNWSDDHRD